MAAPLDKQVNNEIYNQLGERWYTAKDDPIALLRAEARARNPWVVEEIRQAFPTRQVKVLDIGCGAGLLSNKLAEAGFEVVGFDASAQSLEIARRYDQTGRAIYQQGDANHLPFADASFEVACALDFLEHVDDPARILAEAARVLKRDGLFFFHTFNRNLLSWLLGIKGVEWFVKNTPQNLHCYKNFIKPAELDVMCQQVGLSIFIWRGLEPMIAQRAFWKMLLTGTVDDDFRFKFTRSTLIGYTGIAKKS